MKTDRYMNICLEQAALSPLRYRHGCIIVKGGKIIGQGFNDIRPGYDGSTVKTGRLSHRGPAVKSLAYDDDEHDDSSFLVHDSVAKAMSSGHLLGKSLTMHSEMMAIEVALASCSTIPAKSTRAKLQILGDTKRKRRLIRQTIGSYMDNRLAAARATSFSGEETHSSHDYYRDYTKQPKKLAKMHRSPRSRDGSPSDADQNTARKGRKSSPGKRSSKSPQGRDAAQNGTSKGLPLHGGEAGQTINVADRTKHPKLVGADVYVARLCNRYKNAKPKKSRAWKPSTPEPDAPACLTGSLHDELSCSPPRPSDKRTLGEDIPIVAAESRPCYRCVASMYSVGIKRVFWTDREGRWQVNKVRDLVECYQGGSGELTDEPQTGVFVTKHEVLLRRKEMG